MLLFCLSSFAHAADETVAVLGADFWFMPRNGESIAANEGVRLAINKLLAEPDAFLALRYPETESGELWGQELQAWLVSLGLASDRIELQAQTDLLEAIELVVVRPDTKADNTTLTTDALEQDDMEIGSDAENVDLGEQQADVGRIPVLPEVELSEGEAVDAVDVDVQVDMELE